MAMCIMYIVISQYCIYCTFFDYRYQLLQSGLWRTRTRRTFSALAPNWLSNRSTCHQSSSKYISTKRYTADSSLFILTRCFLVIMFGSGNRLLMYVKYHFLIKGINNVKCIYVVFCNEWFLYLYLILQKLFKHLKLDEAFTENASLWQQTKQCLNNYRCMFIFFS